MRDTLKDLTEALDQAGIRSRVPPSLLGLIDPEEWLRELDEDEVEELELEAQRLERGKTRRATVSL